MIVNVDESKSPRRFESELKDQSDSVLIVLAQLRSKAHGVLIHAQRMLFNGDGGGATDDVRR